MTFVKTRIGRGIAIGLAYLAITFAMSYPLVFHLGGFAMVGMEDGSMSVWNLWWTKFSLFQLGQNPLNCGYLFPPRGIDLIFHSLPKVLGLVSTPFQYLFGLTIAYNIIFLLTFIVTALTTYWLVYHLLGERLPAFLAGAFFAFSPYRWEQHSHLQLMSTMLIPVYVLMIIKGREALSDGGWRAWLYFSLAGVALGVTAYDTEYFSIFLLIFSAIYLVFYLPLRWTLPEFRRWSRLLLGLIVAGAVFAVLYLPLLLAAAGELAANGDYVTFPPAWTQYYVTDLIQFITPYRDASLLGATFQHFSRQFTVADTTFLGWMVPSIAVLGMVRFWRRRDTWLWALTAIAFAALALGPNVVINGEIKNISGPYRIITKIPVLSSARVPARFGVITMFAVAVLAGYGASALFGWLRRHRWARLAVPAAAAVILLGMVVEYRPRPAMASLSSPPVYYQIAASDIPGSVITLPMGWEAANDTTGMEHTYVEVFQTVHQRPILGGMTARAPKEEVFRGIYTPVVDFLADPVHLVPSDLDRDPAAITRFQDKYQTAFIVAHKTKPEEYYNDGAFHTAPTDLTPEALARVDDYVTRYLGMEKFADTEEVVAYRRR